MAALDSVADIDRELAEQRYEEMEGHTYLRTSVMTHIAWVPEQWVEAVESVLTGLAERHPSRTIVLLPQPEAEDALSAEVEVESYPVGENRCLCTETIRVQLGGSRAEWPASVVEPLLITDLPVFLRWRGQPDWESKPFGQLVGVTDRLIVDSTEWTDLPAAYGRLAEVFDDVVVSDIAWARTIRWRSELASLWPGIGDVESIRVKGTEAQAHLLAGWLRSRLGREVKLEHEEADMLEAVAIDGEAAPFPKGERPDPADLLSDELDRFSRDRVYEASVRAAAELETFSSVS